MHCISRWGRVVVVASAVTLVGAGAARAEVHSDRAAAIVTYPLVRGFAVDLEPGTTIDVDGNTGTLVEGRIAEETVIQLSNTSRSAVTAHCFYENANAHCTNTGAVCLRGIDCCDGANGCGVCEPGWNELDFRVRLTPRQPIGWLVTEGLTDFPLDDRGQGNHGSRVPPLPETPFLGALKCIVVDDITGAPVARNVLKGEATIEFVLRLLVNFTGTATGEAQLSMDGIKIESHAAGQGGGAQLPPQEVLFTDSAKYSAVGIPAVPDGVNDDRVLVLGGAQAEYGSCPQVLIVNHFFDFAENPVTGFLSETRVALLPCNEDLLRQIPGSAVVQYLVFNEFEQRFSTSRRVECLQYLPLSQIDTTQPERSIFSAGVAGTFTGQTRLQPIGSGLVGVAVEGYGLVTFTLNDRLLLERPGFSAAFNVHFQGDREQPDLITLP